MKENISRVIKIILIPLLLICLFDMPYGYYQLVRFLGFLGFGVLGLFNYQKENRITAFTFVALALLFQPFLKVSLGRDLWNLVDVVVGVALLISIFKVKKDVI